MASTRHQPKRFFIRALSDSSTILQKFRNSLKRSNSADAKTNVRRLSNDLILKGIRQKLLDSENETSAIQDIKLVFDSQANPEDKLSDSQKDDLIDILEMAIEQNMPKLTYLLLTHDIRPRKAEDILLLVTAKGYSQIFNLLLEHEVTVTEDEHFESLLRNIRMPHMVYLFKECGIDFNKNGVGKFLIQTQLSAFWTFYSLGMVNQDQFDTIIAFLKCGVKITEDDLPILQKWPEDTLPRKRDLLVSHLNRIKNELEEDQKQEQQITRKFQASLR